MEEFQLYAKLGFNHITDLNGYDHILFIVALCAIYQFSEWKKLLILVTAFTLGHSLTLALAVLNIIEVPSELIEFLIPVTIVLTAIFNLRKPPAKKQRSFGSFSYWLAAGFGLIHGMGFSNYLRSLLGKNSDIITQLLAFNIGLEVGQLVIVALLLITTFVVVDFARVKHRMWSVWLSGLAAGAALVIMSEKWYF
ncbi:MAG: HupE/UreJ family protein [Spirosomaceae bacterium]|nr:HupE/UreJ family protein [Spirosomataceae bacterium]